LTLLEYLQVYRFGKPCLGLEIYFVAVRADSGLTTQKKDERRKGYPLITVSRDVEVRESPR
jgi:hypothetical protein